MSNDMHEVMIVSFFPLFRRHIESIQNRRSYICDIPWIYQNRPCTKRLCCSYKLCKCNMEIGYITIKQCVSAKICMRTSLRTKTPFFEAWRHKFVAYEIHSVHVMSVTSNHIYRIGIDSQRFVQTVQLLEVQNHIKELEGRFGGKKVILGVDRLDVIKGIPEKLLAFEKFLKDNSNWCDKVVLVQIAVPTRTEVPMYKKFAHHVHEIVGQISGRFGTPTSVPVHFLDQSLDFNTLCALYAVADVALITYVMDGMNLLSYEFVACQASKKGVLVLSEFVGAAQSLGARAILVNPWNITDVASSILYALDMPSEEREKRHNHNFMHVITHTCQKWAETFLRFVFFNLLNDDTVAEAQLRTKRIPPELQTELAVDHYRCYSKRMIILGFNETLTKPVNADGMADQVKETEHNLHLELQQLLKRLCDDPTSTVVIISGSERCVLEKNFEDYNVWLAAEHSVLHVFEYFTTRTPRSYCELRETSIVWSYKYSDFEFRRHQAKDLLNHLRTVCISNASVDIVQGERSVEGVGIHGILGQVIRDKDIKAPIDYVLCVSHFLPKVMS
ncbi:putative alpha,alpha-trehalose-phosphate synthase (UDP-forming) [Helianthus anomalus]